MCLRVAADESQEVATGNTGEGMVRSWSLIVNDKIPPEFWEDRLYNLTYF